MVVANRDLEGSAIDMLNISEALIPCTWMVGVVHLQYMHNHLVDHLFFPIYFGMKGNRFGQLGVHQIP